MHKSPVTLLVWSIGLSEQCADIPWFRNFISNFIWHEYYAILLYTAPYSQYFGTNTGFCQTALVDELSVLSPLIFCWKSLGVHRFFTWHRGESWFIYTRHKNSILTASNLFTVVTWPSSGPTEQMGCAHLLNGS